MVPIRPTLPPDAVGGRDETGKFYRLKKKLFPVRRDVSFFPITKSCFFCDKYDRAVVGGRCPGVRRVPLRVEESALNLRES